MPGQPHGLVYGRGGLPRRDPLRRVCKGECRYKINQCKQGGRGGGLLAVMTKTINKKGECITLSNLMVLVWQTLDL